jgi:hypothetical protein
MSSPRDSHTVTGTGPAPYPAAVSAPRPHDHHDPWLRIELEDVMTPPFAGQPGHGSTAFLRNQPVRIVDGRIRGGYTGVYELICPGCGDPRTWITPRSRRSFSGFAGRARSRRPWRRITGTSGCRGLMRTEPEAWAMARRRLRYSASALIRPESPDAWPPLRRRSTAVESSRAFTGSVSAPIQ